MHIGIPRHGVGDRRRDGLSRAPTLSTVYHAPNARPLHAKAAARAARRPARVSVPHSRTEEESGLLRPDRALST